MDINAAFPSTSPYLKAGDLQGKEVPLTISHVVMETVGDDHKPVVYFLGTERTFVLNKTNANTIASVTGQTDTDMWVNQKIVLIPAQTDFGGKQVPCIRVKLSSVPATRAAPIQPLVQHTPVPPTQPGTFPPPSDAQVQDLNNQTLSNQTPVFEDDIPFN